MSILSRMKRALTSKANSAIDRASDPVKELGRVIEELESTHRAALKELLDHKTTAKRMDQDIARLDDKVELWDRRARAAVKKGEDDLAKTCLREKRQCETERDSIRRDRDESLSYAVELNKSRKQAETKLKMLKMRKGTMATQIASSRSGSSSVFGREDELFDKLDRAGDLIDESAITAEVEASMAGDEVDRSRDEATLEESAGDSGTEASLAELKRRVERDRSKKKLPE